MHDGRPDGVPQPARDRRREEPIRTGGRVTEVYEDGMELSDAFESVSVVLQRVELELEVGDFVLVEGVIREFEVVEAQIIEHARPRGKAREETTRLSRIGENLKERSDVFGAIRAYFLVDQGFVEVDTPAIVPSPGLDVHLDAFEVRDVRGSSFKGAGYLVTSPEYQMKRLLAGGIQRCFQIAHCYRRGEIGRHHNPEFSMLEWYRAFAGMEEVIQDTEAIVRAGAFAPKEARTGGSVAVR